MARKFVDLSIYLENDVLSDPPAFAPKIEYFTHENTFSQIEPFFPGLQKHDLPDGEGWAVERVSTCGGPGEGATHARAPAPWQAALFPTGFSGMRPIKTRSLPQRRDADRERPLATRRCTTWPRLRPRCKARWSICSDGSTPTTAWTASRRRPCRTSGSTPSTLTTDGNGRVGAQHGGPVPRAGRRRDRRLVRISQRLLEQRERLLQRARPGSARRRLRCHGLDGLVRRAGACSLGERF